MKHRVLVVSPHFPPINAADHQCVRMSLPYFAEFGWDVTVLCISPNLIEGIYDPNLTLTIPKNIELFNLRQSLPNYQEDLGWEIWHLDVYLF